MLNEKWQITAIPRKPTPFVIQHWCFTHNGSHYLTAAEGEKWYSSHFSDSDMEKIGVYVLKFNEKNQKI